MRSVILRGHVLNIARVASVIGILTLAAPPAALAAPAVMQAVAPAALPAAPVPDATTVPVDPDPSPSVSPDPIESASPLPTPTDTPTAEPAPEPVDSPEVSPSATPTPTATPTPSPTTTATPVPAVPPAIATSSTSLPTLLIAILVLLAGAVFVWLLLRQRPTPTAIEDDGPVEDVPTSVLLDSMAALGTAMVDSGFPVGIVRSALEDMAVANGRTGVEAVVFPTSIMVSTSDDLAAQTRAVSAGDAVHLLYQVDAVDRIAGTARTRRGAAAWVREQVDRVADLPLPYSPMQRIGGYAIMSAALSVLLGSSWGGVALAGVLGLAVGAVLIATAHLASTYQALVVVGVSLGVSLIVLLVAHTLDPGVLPAMVAPLVMLLPGGLLTIGVLELATGQIMSGAARLAAGAMRLVLLATGIVAAAALVGIPVHGDSLDLGPIAPWVAVAVFGLGITVYQCARPGSIGWIMVVLYVAFGAQVLGDVLFGGVLSALVGAAAMTPVAVVIARQRTGPPALVSFLPAFWLLVPGALGLIGVATVLDGDVTGTSTIITTVATMVAIALGVLVGLALAGSLRAFENSRVDESADRPSPGTVS